MDYTLKDLLNIPKLRELLDSVDEIHSLPSAILDTEGNVLIATAWQDICTKFHRVNPETAKKCVESDRHIDASLVAKTPLIIYRCPMGLVDSAAPIIIEGQHLGNVFTGQLFMEPPDESYFINQARQYGFDETEYMAAMRKVPLFHEEKLRKNLAFIRNLTQLFAEQELQLKRQLKAEEELQEAQAMFRIAFDNAPTGMSILGPDRRYLAVNPLLGEMFGYSKEEFLENTIHLVTHPEDEERSNEWIRKKICGEPCESELEKRYIHKDGHIVWGLVRAQWIKNKDGSPRMSIAHVLDITKRKLAEAALKEKMADLARQNDALLRAQFSIDRARDAIFWIRPDGSFLYVNEAACRSLGYSKAELLALTVFDIDPVFRRDRWEEHWQKSRAIGSHVIETSHQTKDGRIFPVEVAIDSVNFSGEEFHCSYCRDITVRKQTEEKQKKLEAQLLLAQKLESIGRLAGGVAHDFNNLLTPILGYSELLKSSLPAGSSDSMKIDSIIKAADKARVLTQQLLSFGRKQILEMKAIDMNAVVTSFHEILRRTIRENIDIQLHLTHDRLGIRGDRNQLEQIIMNLAVNAQDSIAGNGIITIETAPATLDDDYVRQHAVVQAGNYLMLAITDSGCGMDQETLAHIFEPFYTTKALGEGTGLGLATVYGLVKQHDGYIWVYSEPGKGSVFKLYFPLVDEMPASDAKKVPEQLDVKGNDQTILLVEDNEMVRQLVYDLLVGYGFRVLVSENPQQAVKMSVNQHLDLLVTDVVMPEMTGPELHTRLLQSHQGLKVLYMSGYTNNVIVHHGVLNEGINFIQKPFTVNDLAKKVEAVLSADSADG